MRSWARAAVWVRTYLAAQGPQRGRLSALVVAQHQQVRVASEIDGHRLASTFLEAEQDVRTEFVAGSGHDAVVVHARGQ